jgi:FMN hydrolase / 5-amino-6-(5-phospho-D-ribitylamino)uracil phosphatase
MTVLALTLDLDDTLWPIAPVIVRAEQVTHQWLAQHAPATAQRFDVTAMRNLRADVGRRHPHLVHDLSQLRLIALRESLLASGDDPALAEPAFEVFFAQRQQVEFYADVIPALDRLAARFPLLALSNGNADLTATGLSRWFSGAVSARSAGMSKPDVRIFNCACEMLSRAAAQVMHVGDDFVLDIEGARAAGMQTAWIRRGDALQGLLMDGVEPAMHRHLQVPDLLALADLLGA